MIKWRSGQEKCLIKFSTKYMEFLSNVSAMKYQTRTPLCNRWLMSYNLCQAKKPWGLTYLWNWNGIPTTAFDIYQPPSRQRSPINTKFVTQTELNKNYWKIMHKMSKLSYYHADVSRNVKTSKIRLFFMSANVFWHKGVYVPSLKSIPLLNKSFKLCFFVRSFAWKLWHFSTLWA